MPMQSKAQARAMYAAADGQSTLGIPAKVGKEFVKANKGHKLSKLPEHKGKKKHKQMVGEPHYYKRKSGSTAGDTSSGIGGVSGGGAAGGGA